MKRLFLVALALWLTLQTACLASVDPVVAEVCGVKITRAQVEAEMTTVDVLYGFLGKRLTDDEIAAKKATARAEILGGLIEREILQHQMRARGIILAGGAQEAADQKYMAAIRAIEDYVLKTYPSLTGAELESQVDTMLKAAGETRTHLRDAASEVELTDALYESVYAECPAVTEAEIAAYYETLYEEQKQTFGASVNEYEAALLAGDIITTRPVDEKRIKKAEFRFDREIIALLAQMKLYGKAEDEQAMLDDQYALLSDKVEDIYESLLAGETSFDEVLEGIEPGSSKVVNYFSAESTRFPEAYRTRALEFQSVGEISTAYKIDNGYAVLYYAGDLPGCEKVPLPEVADQIAARLLEDARKKHLEETLAIWRAQAEVVRYEENLK